ncbi:MAG: DUF2723 domain-containing protein [Anaerolineae bacterium]|nr:DUF2723 domain-containing protein [Anaerolineae bacterium]
MISPRLRSYLILVGCLLVLNAVYLPTLLTQISGGRDAAGNISPYMDDVGEIQVALNVWGTIHHTGYPLYTVLGNICVAVLRVLGLNPAAAPAIYALLWGLLGLAVFYLLLLNLTAKPLIAAACTLILGLTRTIWIHNIIAEVYSMSFALSMLLVAIALWRGEMTVRRLWLLALVGGIGVAHHRLIFFLTPGLFVAVLPHLRLQGRRLISVLLVALLIGLLGFIPYIYLPLRAQAGAAWVYGDPSTFSGFWHEFTGAEAAFLMQPSSSLIDDLRDSLNIIVTELQPFLAVISLSACLYALTRPRHRREMLIALLCIAMPFIYLIVQHRVVMPQAVAMPIIAVLVLGLGLALDTQSLSTLSSRLALWFMAVTTIFLSLTLIIANQDFILGLTKDQTGLRMIETAQRVPRDGGHAVLMLPWGPNYTAVGFSKYVTGENADLRLIPHTVDFRSLARENDRIYTFKDVFYRFGLDFWDAQFGRVYLSTAAEDVIAIKREPLIAQPLPDEIPVTDGIFLRSLSACNDANELQITIVWRAQHRPGRDFRVFVHLLSAQSDVPLTQADSTAPVYGWYPTSRWSAGEVIYDLYTLPRLPDGVRLAVGMYEQVNDEFRNYGRTVLPLDFALSCDALKP